MLKKILLLTILQVTILMAGSFVMTKGNPLIKANTDTPIEINYDKEVTINSIEQLEQEVANATVSTKIIVQDGIYNSKDITLKNNSANVYIVAQNRNQAVFQKLIVIYGSNITIDGFLFNGGSISNNTGGAIISRGDNNRITRCTWDDSKSHKWCRSIRGYRFTIDHCTFKNKTNNASIDQGYAIIVYSFMEDTIPREHHIHHNYFYNIVKGQDSNGYESIIVYSEKSETDSSTPPIAYGIDHNIIVEYNLFENADGEGEIISGKTKGSIYQYNKFINSAGGITLRYGKNCIVGYNNFLGNEKRGSYGIRVMGDNQHVHHNFVENASQETPGIELYNGSSVTAPATNFNIHDNYIIGGQYTIRFGRSLTNPTNKFASGTMKDNIFIQKGEDQTLGARQILSFGNTDRSGLTFGNNKYHGTLGQENVSGYTKVTTRPQKPSVSSIKNIVGADSL